MFFPVLSFLLAGLLAPEAPDSDVWRQSDARDGQCSLAREIVRDGRTLRVTKSLGNDEYVIGIEEPGAKVRYREYKDVELTLDDDWARRVSGASGSTEVPTTSILDLSLIDPGFLERLASAHSLKVTHPKIGSILIGPGASGFPIAELQRCEEARLRKLGLDPLAWQSRAKPVPVLPVGQLFSGDDYTPAMIRRMLSGTVPVLLTVSAEGRVKRCEPLPTDADALLKERTCEVVSRKARFAPPIGGAGTPLESQYLSTISFLIVGG